MSERITRVGLGVLSGTILLLSLAVRLPEATGGRFWSDGATYYSMASSLAFDGDLEFREEDLARVRTSYPTGPQGVFLKRVPNGHGGSRLTYAKPVVYPLLAAPVVRIFGVDRGLSLLNALFLVASLWASFGLLRETQSAPAAAAGAVAIILGGVAPVYVLWQSPELCYLALVAAGLVAWRRDRPLLAAGILGVAVYAKPTHAALALPLLFAPLLGGDPSRSSPTNRVRLALEAGRRLLILFVTAGVAFGANRWMTGEFNYQGGVRKTFYDVYPYDPGVTFDSAGVWMTTDHVGPLVAGADETPQATQAAPARDARELRQSLLWNLLYFWLGRFGGLVPYLPGFASAVLLFAVSGPRRREGWLAFAGIAVSWIGYVLIIPDNWYGGAGAIGNRYFLSALPLGALVVPRRRAVVVALLSCPVVGLLLGPILSSPVRHSLAAGEHGTRAVFRLLPAELTMLSDLPVFTDVWRRRRPYNAPGGDPARRPPGADPCYFLWFLDDGTFGQETSFGEEGFWTRGGQSAEVVLQTLAPPPSIRLAITAGPGGDIFTARIGRWRRRLVLRPLRTEQIVIEPGAPALRYYDTPLYRLALTSRFGGSTARDGRSLGSFVRLVLGETGRGAP